MRYHFEKPKEYAKKVGEVYVCNHPVYSRCTLFRKEEKGLAVIQQRFYKAKKLTLWTEVDPWVAEAIFVNSGFEEYFERRSGKIRNGLFPTVTVRQIMWALRMKPIKKERWETVFDRRSV